MRFPHCSNRFQQGVTSNTGQVRLTVRGRLCAISCRRQCCKTHFWPLQIGVPHTAAFCWTARCSLPTAAAARRPISEGGASAMDPAKCLEILGNRGTCSGLHGAHHHGHAAGVLGHTFFFLWGRTVSFRFRRRLPQIPGSAHKRG